jgi:hypothetical protein
MTDRTIPPGFELDPATGHYRRRQPQPATPAPVTAGKAERKAAEPNQTEREAAAVLLRLCDLTGGIYEGLQVILGEHVFTPDWFYPGARVAVEVKGQWKHASQGRSRLAFDLAREKMPGLTWLWMEKRKASRGKAQHWRIEHYGATNG